MTRWGWAARLTVIKTQNPHLQTILFSSANFWISSLKTPSTVALQSNDPDGLDVLDDPPEVFSIPELQLQLLDSAPIVTIDLLF